MRRTLAAALAAILGILACASGAAGAEGAALALLRADANESWIRVSVPPGGEARGRAVVRNLTDRPQTAALAAVDATTTSDGAFTLAGDSAERRGVGRWTSVSESRIALAPGDQRVVDYRVAVPAGAEPGDYAGGLVAQADAPVQMGAAGTVAVNVVERVGLRIYVDVVGERDGTVRVEKLDVTAQGGSVIKRAVGLPAALDASFTVRNEGNVRYEDLGATVELWRGDEVVETRSVDLGTLLPGAERPAALRLPLPGYSAGDWKVAVRVDSQPPAELAVERPVSGLRAWMSGLLVATGLIGAAGAGVRRRRSGRGGRR